MVATPPKDSLPLTYIRNLDPDYFLKPFFIVLSRTFLGGQKSMKKGLIEILDIWNIWIPPLRGVSWGMRIKLSILWSFLLCSLAAVRPAYLRGGNTMKWTTSRRQACQVAPSDTIFPWLTFPSSPWPPSNQSFNPSWKKPQSRGQNIKWDIKERKKLGRRKTPWEC